jgi:hypothetical protein
MVNSTASNKAVEDTRAHGTVSPAAAWSLEPVGKQEEGP